MSEKDTTAILDAARSVPCIEVLAKQAPRKSKRAAGPYYPDESELLVSTLKGLRNREAHFVALGADGLVNVYRRARK